MPDKKVGILQGEAELSQGLSVLILWLGIRPCASQIYPYVTKKQVVSQPACRDKELICSRCSFSQELATLLGACLLL